MFINEWLVGAITYSSFFGLKAVAVALSFASCGCGVFAFSMTALSVPFVGVGGAGSCGVLVYRRTQKKTLYTYVAELMFFLPEFLGLVEATKDRLQRPLQI